MRSCVDFIAMRFLSLVLFAFYKPLQHTMLNSFFIAFVFLLPCISVAFRVGWMDAAKRNSHKDYMRWSFRRAATTSTITRGNSKNVYPLISFSLSQARAVRCVPSLALLFFGLVCLFVYLFSFYAWVKSLCSFICVYAQHNPMINVYLSTRKLHKYLLESYAGAHNGAVGCAWLGLPLLCFDLYNVHIYKF